MHIIPLKLLSLQGDGHHILIEVEIIGKTFKMVLDTGASKTVLDSQTLINAGISEDNFLLTDILSTGLGTNEMKSYMFHLETFKIGTWSCKKMDVAILDLSSINFAYSQMNYEPVVGVLGGDILLQYGAVINYKNMTLKLNSNKKRRE